LRTLKTDRDVETPYMSESKVIHPPLGGTPSLPTEVRPSNFKHLAMVMKGGREGEKFTYNGLSDPG
jgi:hypothetical protein